MRANLLLSGPSPRLPRVFLPGVWGVTVKQGADGGVGVGRPLLLLSTELFIAPQRPEVLPAVDVLSRAASGWKAQPLGSLRP